MLVSRRRSARHGLGSLKVCLPRAEPRVVVELFTSQGCSSCPAADKLLGELAKDPSVIADRASPSITGIISAGRTRWLCRVMSKRQRAYAGSRAAIAAVYTPQVVINGTAHVLGSDKAAIERAVKRARRMQLRLAIAG